MVNHRFCSAHVGRNAACLWGRIGHGHFHNASTSRTHHCTDRRNGRAHGCADSYFRAGEHTPAVSDYLPRPVKHATPVGNCHPCSNSGFGGIDHGSPYARDPTPASISRRSRRPIT